MNMECRLCAIICSNEDLAINISNIEVQELFEKCNVLIDKKDKKLTQICCSKCFENIKKFGNFLDKIKEVQEILRRKSNLPEEYVKKDEPDPEVKIEFEDYDDAGDSDILFGKYENITITPITNKKKSRVANSENPQKSCKSWKKYSMAEIFEKQLREVPLNKSLGFLDVLDDEKRSDGSLNEKGLAKCSSSIKWSDMHIWTCTVCTLEFSSRKDLAFHYRHIHKTEPKYLCTLCSKVFVIYSAFHNHLISHDPVLKFCCFFCSTFYCDLVSLYNHQTREHDSTSHFCLYCGLISKTSGKLKDHVVSQHLKPEEIVEVYTCDLCGKNFNTRKFVRAHILLHLANQNGKKDYICHVCGKRFAQKKYLYGHRLVHSTDRPFQCEYCPKNYKSKRELGQHYLARHPDKNHDYKNKKVRTKKYSCEVCNQGFMSLKVMLDHKNTHLGLTPHQCFQCGKKFCTLKFLRLHQARHTTEKKHRCSICNAAFKVRADLTRHVKRSHRNIE